MWVSICILVLGPKYEEKSLGLLLFFFKLFCVPHDF